MTDAWTHRTLSEPETAALTVVSSGPRNLRRDLYKFADFVRKNTVKRTYRENLIPKAVAKRLARILSDPEEETFVEENGQGLWTEIVGSTAKALGIVQYSEDGVYAGFASENKSYPDNYIQIVEPAWAEYCQAAPAEKETRILKAIAGMAGNEFFHCPDLVHLDCFPRHDGTRGPATRMNLPVIRRALFEMLAELPPGAWIEFRDFVEMVRHRAPDLILGPETCGPNPESARKLREWEYENKYRKKSAKQTPRPAIILEDRYCNFREYEPRPEAPDQYFHAMSYEQLAVSSPNGFHRVEGRYLERFLCQGPFLAGFVDLAFLPGEDRRGQETIPSFERLRAFRPAPRLRLAVRKDRSLNGVNLTVLPSFEIVVDAPSYPDEQLSLLEPYTVIEYEDAHLHRLRLDRKKVVAFTASQPADAPRARDVLARLSKNPLPENVRHELEAWTGHAEKLTFFDSCGFVELRGDAEHAERIERMLKPYVVERLETGLVVRTPDLVRQALEEELIFPLGVGHAGDAFCAPEGLFRMAAESRTVSEQARKAGDSREKTTVATEDLAGFRSANPKLLKALAEILKPVADPCHIVEGSLLVIPAAVLPAARKALRTLSERFDVEG